MTTEQLQHLISCDESYRIELTESTGNMDKFQEAICAFANDLPGSRKKGYLLIGVRNDGSISGLKVDDALMVKISSIRSDGNILPLPVMNTEKVETPEGDVLVVEVAPSFDTPVRYRGRTFIRIGPRRDIASPQEERILSERCAAALPTFDTHPCRNAALDDLEADLIEHEYLPLAISPEVLAHDQRPLKEKLSSIHLWNLQCDCPTYAALIMFGKNPRFFMPGAYIQFVHFKGETNGGAILNERRFEGCLYKVLPLLDNFIRDGIVTNRPISVSVLREKNVTNYPFKAIHELMMNACMHRDYQSNMPTRFYLYDRHIEIMNPGGLYGQARPENFPLVNDYRNNVVAEMMRNLNYVNMFNHGISEVQRELDENGNPAAQFNVNLLTAFSVSLHDNAPTYEESIENTSTQATVHQLFTLCSEQVKDLIVNFQNGDFSIAEIRLFTSCPPRSKPLYIEKYIAPSLGHGLIEPTHPDKPNHPHQKYHLTELGHVFQQYLKQQQS